jgi:hypothetical protein
LRRRIRPTTSFQYFRERTMPRAMSWQFGIRRAIRRLTLTCARGRSTIAGALRTFSTSSAFQKQIRSGSPQRRRARILEFPSTRPLRRKSQYHSQRAPATGSPPRFHPKNSVCVKRPQPPSGGTANSPPILRKPNLLREYPLHLSCFRRKYRDKPTGNNNATRKKI